ncbi:hypothetical protein AB0F36_08010 [Streptomyces sp. NPDC029080]|uniref:hypothetical protein n=1 Tax=Streptomyces sp. NPDC029080 TaxID=3155017 RepID=UPI00340A5EF9
MSLAVAEITLTESLSDWAGQNYSYSRWEFEDTAEKNEWTAIGVVMDNDSPASSSTDQRYYVYDTPRWAQGASNAEAIEEALNAADGGHGWAYGPGETFVYDANNAAVAAVVEELESVLASYGYLNEERASELEDEENHPDEFTCHAGRDCSCDVATHECSEVFAAGVECDEITAEMDEWHCPYCKEDYKIGADERKVMARILARKWHEEIQAAGQMTVFMFVAA